MAGTKTIAFTTIANFADQLDHLCSQAAPKRKPLAVKKKKVKKAKKDTAGKAEGPAKNAAGAAKTKEKTDMPMAVKAKLEFQAEKKRVHSKAYHAAYTNAKSEGKGAEEAKAMARKAGTEAARAWAAIHKG